MNVSVYNVTMHNHSDIQLSALGEHSWSGVSNYTLHSNEILHVFFATLSLLSVLSDMWSHFNLFFTGLELPNLIAY